MNWNPTTTFLALFLLLLILRKYYDRQLRIHNHREWCKKHLAGTRRTVSELIDNRPPSHHIT